MNSIPPLTETISGRLWSPQTMVLARPVRLLVAVFLGSLLLWASAKIQVPMPPVPVTLQTGAVALLALVLGFRLAMMAVALYLAQGALGLPVFSAGGGAAYLVATPTAGFLWGFALIVVVVSGLYQVVAPYNRVLAAVVAGLLGIYAAYLPGLVWLHGFIGDWDKTLAVGLWPFVLGDAIKGLLAALLALAIGRGIKRR